MGGGLSDADWRKSLTIYVNRLDGMKSKTLLNLNEPLLKQENFNYLRVSSKRIIQSYYSRVPVGHSFDFQLINAYPFYYDYLSTNAGSHYFILGADGYDEDTPE
ncbi:hypothetical protein [Ornithobacterium rhinotracheale]|uniref:hypothetical protein n=1 Tax=Ornithobacterium rhinotracheale TaxID=28251 RepID=UPI001FF34E51|nr:hypothetical protein [Ornithobacterium rhinotracheale]MCK0206395.1 hypothetical protein [Ornithobacterium rhinotracheale]